MRDRFERTINYMRISVTDRCNLRCRYCMPDGITKCSMQEILTYEEIIEIAEAAEDCGITRFKVTGGEPLVRRGVETLVCSLKELPLTEQVTLTTNGKRETACSREGRIRRRQYIPRHNGQGKIQTDHRK